MHSRYIRPTSAIRVNVIIRPSARSFHVDFQFRVRVELRYDDPTRSQRTRARRPRVNALRDGYVRRARGLRANLARRSSPLPGSWIPFSPLATRRSLWCTDRPYLSLFVLIRGTIYHAARMCVCSSRAAAVWLRSTIRRMQRFNEWVGRKGKHGKMRVAVESSTSKYADGQRLLKFCNYY